MKNLLLIKIVNLDSISKIPNYIVISIVIDIPAETKTINNISIRYCNMQISK